jgi:hypothetical protein
LNSYLVHLKLGLGAIPLEAEKFSCERGGYVVFYARPGPGIPFEEVAIFSTKNVGRIEEKPCKQEHK